MKDHQDTNSHFNVRLIGYCEKETHEIGHLIKTNQLSRLREMEGEYTIVYTKGEFVCIITSPIGAIQYFYYYDGNRFFHGEEIVKIARDAKLQWEWDYESLGDLCELENLTGERTLHKRIKRVPPFSVVKYDKRLNIYSTKLISTFDQVISRPTDAVEIINKEIVKWVSLSPFISLSGGFDSRVILSSMLYNSIYPTVVTVGEDESTDVKVARAITKKYGLEHRVVQLALTDLLENSENIARITNGSKPTCHWNTYLYPKKASVPRDQSFYVGTLGEFARNYYCDKGIAALFLDGMPHGVQSKFWRQKILRHQGFRSNELSMLSEKLNVELCWEGIIKRAQRNSIFSGKTGFIEAGTRYYLEQRVPNFYANGIKMYNSTSNWRSPFHNVEWLNKIWNLNETWKLGSNWHRLAIRKNWPDLMNFPEEKGFLKNRMMNRAVPFYWLPMMQRSKYRTYDQSREWYKSNEIRELMMDNRQFLSELMEIGLIEKVLNQHKTAGDRTKTISFLLTVVFFCIAKSRG